MFKQIEMAEAKKVTGGNYVWGGSENDFYKCWDANGNVYWSDTNQGNCLKHAGTPKSTSGKGAKRK